MNKKGKAWIWIVLVILIIIIGIFLYFSDDEATKNAENIDYSECLSLQGENKMIYSAQAFECWVNLAKEHKDSTICEKGFKEKYMSDCYKSVSQYFNDVSMCDSLEFVGVIENLNPIERKFECYVDFADKNNWDVCEDQFLMKYTTTDNHSGSDFCYLIIVSRGNNLLGKSLTDEEIVRLCEKIDEEEYEGSCLNYVGDPFNIPQEIKDKYPGRYSN